MTIIIKKNTFINAGCELRTEKLFCSLEDIQDFLYNEKELEKLEIELWISSKKNKAIGIFYRENINNSNVLIETYDIKKEKSYFFEDTKKAREYIINCLLFED